jgi:nucleoside-diphosphate-sugar epimerase
MSYFSGKTVLITGATGLVGSHLVNKLMAMGDVQVIALSRSEQKLKNTFALYLDSPYFSYIAQDVTQPFDLSEKMVDVIFHAASPISGKTIANTPVDVIYPNIIGTINCLELLRKQRISSGKNKRIVLFSSATVYGNISGKDVLVSEDDTAIASPLDSGNSAYSESKRMTEVIAQAYIRQYNIDTVIARPSYIYGNAASQPETAFFSFIDKIVANEDIVINNSGLARRDNIYIDDVVSGLLVICEKGETGQAYNISSNAELGNFTAIDETAEIMTKIASDEFNCSSRVLYNSDKSETRMPGIILSNEKLKALGWQLTTSQTNGIRKILAERMNGLMGGII